MSGEIKCYNCELHWRWGNHYHFAEVYRFRVNDKTEIDFVVRSFVERMVERYAFDCGQIDSPLRPDVCSLNITPVRDEVESIYFGTEYHDLIDELTAKKRALLEVKP